MSRRITILGGEAPLGREIRERISELVPGLSFRVASGAAVPASAEPGEEDDAETPPDPLDRELLLSSAVVICAGQPSLARQAWQLAGGEAGPPFVDLTYGLESLPEARLRSPLTSAAGFNAAETNLHVIASPAASALALLLLHTQPRLPLRHALAQVFEPASERGQAGLTELQRQVMSLLSFRPLEKRIFDAQLGFNLLGRYGEDAPEQLADIEARLERHLASLLAGAALMPSLRLIQAPVFHGHTISLWLEFEERPEVEDLEAELEAGGIEVRGADVEAPNNAGATGQPGVTVGLIEADRNHPRGMWVWAVADNYRLSADNAAAVVRRILDGEA